MSQKVIKKVVVKIGSSVIAPFGRLDSSLIDSIVEDIIKAEKTGVKVVLVSSGAIASGLNVLGYKRRPTDTHSLMAISSVGQIALMDIFNAKFKKSGRMCAQILLTWDDFDDRQRFMNIRKTIDKLMSMNIVPVINENDVISFQEIRFGDNDCLSALVADLVNADLLIMLSDVKGLLKEGELVNEVKEIDSSIASLARREDKVYTSGGMLTKLKAAKVATASGIKTVIAYGREKGVILNILNGKNIGTLFLPSQSKDRARKRWIAFSKKIKGRICIDDGAKDALLNRGKSLLGVGITAVERNFKKGDAVEVLDSQGKVAGCGLVNYSSQELEDAKKKGLKKEVIHRDDFVKASGNWHWDSCIISEKRAGKDE